VNPIPPPSDSTIGWNQSRSKVKAIVKSASILNGRRGAMSEVRLPNLGEIDEVTVVDWLKKEGETLKTGEDLLEVETEKTTFVIETPQAGRLVRIVKKKGEKARLDDLLAEIE